MKRISKFIATIMILSLLLCNGDALAAGELRGSSCKEGTRSDDYSVTGYCDVSERHFPGTLIQSRSVLRNIKNVIKQKTGEFDEDNPFTWRDIKQYYAYGNENCEYVIALGRNGKMYACNLLSESVDDDLIETIRSYENIREFYPYYAWNGLIIAASGNNGSFYMTCSQSISDDYGNLCRKAENFTHVSSVAYGTDDCGGVRSVCLLLADGTVRSTNDTIDKGIRSWKNISKIYGTLGENYIGIKEDGSCVGYGDLFEYFGFPYTCQYAISDLENIESVCYYVAPYGIRLFLLGTDGSVFCNCDYNEDWIMDTEPVLHNAEALNYDTGRNWDVYVLDAKGVCRSYDAAGFEFTYPKWEDTNIKTVGIDGLCVKKDGTIVSGAFYDGLDESLEYTVCSSSDFNKMETNPDTAVRSVDFRANRSAADGRYWAITEDNSLRMIITNQYD